MFEMEIEAAESVTIGHPDRICDQIADAILAEYVRLDPHARVAIECMGGHGKLWICGEVTSTAKVDAAKIAQQTYEKTGYSDILEIEVHIAKQSPDIARGVADGGAGDQGIVYGFATNETPEMLPAAFALAKKLTDRLTKLRQTDPRFSWLRPDGKSLVVTKNKKPIKVIVSAQHSPEISIITLRNELYQHVILPIIPNINKKDCFINNTGRFVQGGFEADTGLTGRKLMVDSHGGLSLHGGGSIHGKDNSKVDRSAATQLRQLAVKQLKKTNNHKVLAMKVFCIGEKAPLAEAVLLG